MPDEMTSRDRVLRTLNFQPIDYVPSHDHFWGDTQRHWKETGQVAEDADIGALLDMDFVECWCLNSVADLDFEPVTLEETEETILTLNGNGATLRHHKLHASTPEHVDFKVKERSAWEELIKPHLLEVDTRRFNLEAYRNARQRAAERDLFLTWSGVAPFEQMHPICGHEYMLMGMALDPDWVRDMVTTYADFTIMHLEELFGREGKPDGVYVYEDMGFKNKPFMSPAMYREILQPGHKRLFDWCHSQGLKVIVHSCGFVEQLVPGLVEAGMDCLQAMEVKAGMDMRNLLPAYRGTISFFGNMDVRVLISNDKEKIRAELEAKLPAALKDGGRYILMSDHSIPPDVHFETMQYFLETGRALSREILGREAG